VCDEETESLKEKYPSTVLINLQLRAEGSLITTHHCWTAQGSSRGIERRSCSTWPVGFRV